MAKIVEQNYEQMIDTLRNEAANIATNAENMISLSNVCVMALGDEDSGAEQLAAQTQESAMKFYQCAKAAVSIAQAMQEELDAARRESAVWASED